MCRPCSRPCTGFLTSPGRSRRGFVTSSDDRAQEAALAPLLLSLIIMRSLLFCLLLSAGACNSGTNPASDASTAADLSSGSDAAADAAANDAAAPDATVTCPPLLVGGTDVTAQGWSIVMQAPATVSYGPDYVRLQTSTPTGGRSGGQLLLSYSDALAFGKPFILRVVMLFESVDAHNPLDSAAAIMGSFTPSVGNAQDRAQMLYLDSEKVGWADDTQSFTTAVQDNTYHTYELSVDAGQVARVSVDGKPVLTRNGFVFNGKIAIGDQSNDANVDSALRIRSVA